MSVLYPFVWNYHVKYANIAIEGFTETGTFVISFSSTLIAYKILL